MDIAINNIGKKYSSAQWVFRKFNENIAQGEKIAITGNNGSGKSTLLKIIAGLLIPSEGNVNYTDEQQIMTHEDAFYNMNYAAPYVQLIEEFSVLELLNFHFKFKKLFLLENIEQLMEVLYLSGNEHKRVKDLSSGMKQRLKLGLSLFSKSDIVLLDEPTTNLDQKGIAWYLDTISNLFDRSTIIIASNQKKEYPFCNKIIDMNKLLLK